MLPPFRVEGGVGRGNGQMTAKEEQALWQEALQKARTLDAALQADDLSAAARLSDAFSDWLAAQEAVPRLAGLARLVTPGLTRRQLWCVLVPIERRIAKLKVTDVEILEGDADGVGEGKPPMALTVVLDSLRSAFNVGGIFRTAECFGAERIILCGYTATPEDPRVARAALGTERRVPWRYTGDIREAVAALQAEGTPCIALETVPDAPPPDRFEWPFPCALLLGNERFGLPADVVSRCAGVVRIPLFGAKNSLNVGSAFAIAANAIRRSWEAR